MTAWLKTSRPELARRCAYCGAPRGHYCVTSGGRFYGWHRQSHAVRFSPQSASWTPLDHGPCAQAPGGSTWRHFGGR